MANDCEHCGAIDDHYVNCKYYRSPTTEDMDDVANRVMALEYLIEPIRPVLERYASEADEGEEFGTWLARNSIVHWNRTRPL